MKSKFTTVVIIALAFITVFAVILGVISALNKCTRDKAAKMSEKIKSGKATEKKPESDSLFLLRLDSANQSAEALLKTMSGRKVTLLITGVDVRLGSGSVHADANHLLNIWLDSGKIEIMSIPRGTFCDLGFSDSLHLNYLANVRSTQGPVKYREAVRRITKSDSIQFYVEFGFSQAIGLLELLGFKENPVQMLRVLRSRKAFGVGDYQRAYNQGQFIRQMLLTKFNSVNNLFGDLLIRSGLVLVDNNLTFSDVKTIIKELEKKKFPRSPDDVIIHLVPSYEARLRDFNFTDQNEIDSLYKRIARSTYYDSSITDKKIFNSDNISRRVSRKLTNIIKNASQSLNKNPENSIKLLYPPFKQKTWFQISDTKLRDSLKLEIYQLMIKAYYKTNQQEKALYVLNVMQTEQQTINISKDKKKSIKER